MEKTFINKSLEKSKQALNNITKLDLKKEDLGRKIFDNIVWVVVLVIVFFVLITAYLSTNSFNNSYKISELDKAYKGKIKLNDLTVKSLGQDAEEFDEIDPKRNNLCDVYISSSRRSYLIGRQLFDFCSKDMILKVLKMGARFIELDLYMGQKNQIVIANGLTDGKWIFTLNTISFKDFMKSFSETLFDPNTYENPNDPILLFLNINIPKPNIEELYNIINESIGKNLASKKYNLAGGQNILETPLIELMNKVILMTSGKIGDTKLMELVHLRLGDRVRRMTYKEVFNSNQMDMINFNKKHLTIVVPENGIRALNYNPEMAFDYGCQIVTLHFQNIDNKMAEYISKFDEKSFQIKPFEFTRFADIPQVGYDQDKIAYYDTYDKVQGEEKGNEIKNKGKECSELLNSPEVSKSDRDKLRNLRAVYIPIKDLNSKVKLEELQTPEELEGGFTNDNMYNKLIFMNHYLKDGGYIQDDKIKYDDLYKILKKKRENISYIGEKEPLKFTNTDDDPGIEIPEKSKTKIINKFNLIWQPYKEKIKNIMGDDKTLSENEKKNIFKNLIFFDKFVNIKSIIDKQINIQNDIQNDNYNTLDDNIKKLRSDSIKVQYQDFKKNLPKIQEIIDKDNSEEPFDTMKYKSLQVFQNLKKSITTLFNMIKKERNQAESKIVASLRNICEGDKRCFYTKPTSGTKNTGIYGKCEDKKAPCCKVILNVDDIFKSIDDKDDNDNYTADISKISQIRMKLKQFNIREHADVSEIEKLHFVDCPSKKEEKQCDRNFCNWDQTNKKCSFDKSKDSDFNKIEDYKDKHVMKQDEKDAIGYNKNKLVYYILRKQLVKAIEKEKRKTFDTNYVDDCFGRDAFNCDEQKMCISQENKSGRRCQKSTSNIPYPNFCVPRDVLPNRNSCPGKNYDKDCFKLDEKTCNGNIKCNYKDNNCEGKPNKLHNQALRGILHRKHTDYQQGFAGNWSAIGGVIEIEDKYDEFCEFKFTTPTDNKQYSMVIVTNAEGSGDSITFENMNDYSYQAGREKKNYLRAKGTFIDPEIRKIEEMYNLPPLKFHGYADMKMFPYNSLEKDTSLKPQEITQDKIENCFKEGKLNQDVFYGVYKFTPEVNDLISNKETEKFSYFIRNYINNYKFGETDKTTVQIKLKKHYLMSSYKEVVDIDNKKYAYRMLDPGCNRQLQKMFGREVNSLLSKPKKEKIIFDTKNLPDLKIEEFSNISQSPLDSYKRTLLEEFEPRMKKADILSKTIFGRRPPKEGIQANELQSFFFSKKMTKSRFNRLSKDVRLLYANLTEGEVDYAKNLNDKDLVDFLNMTDEQKEAVAGDMYETKKPEGKKFPVDLIQDKNDDLDTCLQKNYYEAERCYQPRLSKAQRNKRKWRKICNIPQCDYSNAYITSCTEDKYEQPPYCSSGYDKWIVTQNKGQRNQEIRLYDFDEGDSCELNDTDYKLDDMVKNNPARIQKLQIYKREVMAMNEPPGYKEKAKEYDKKIKAAEEERKEATKNKPGVSINKQIPPEKGSRDRLKKAEALVKKLKKEKQELLPKMKEKEIKPIDDKIKLLQTQMENASKEIEKKKKNGTYSEPSPHLCLGYGEVKDELSYNGRIIKSDTKLQPKVLYCDKRRNLQKMNNFNFKWKVLKIPNTDNDNEFVIKSDDGKLCLTKKRLLYASKDEDDEEEDEQVNPQKTNIFDPNYFFEIGSGKFGSIIGLEPCEIDVIDEKNNMFSKIKYKKKPLYGKDKTITMDIINESITQYDNIYYLFSPIGHQFLKTHQGLDFLLSSKGKQFINSEDGKKVLNTPVGKQVQKILNQINGILNNYTYFISKDKSVPCVGQGGTDRCIEFLSSPDGINFLRTKKGQEFLNSPNGKKILVNPKIISFFDTDEGMKYLDSGGDELRKEIDDEYVYQHYKDTKYYKYERKISKMKRNYLNANILLKAKNKISFSSYLTKPDGVYFLGKKEGNSYLNSLDGKTFLYTPGINNFLKSKYCIDYLLTNKGGKLLKSKFGNKFIKSDLMDIFLLRDKKYDFLSTKKGKKYLTTKNGLDLLRGEFGTIFFETPVGKSFMESKYSIPIRKILDNIKNQSWRITTVDDINVCKSSQNSFKDEISKQGSKDKGTTNTDKNKESLGEKTGKDNPEQKEYPKKKAGGIKGL